ncbi:MAG: hypothetical protein IJW06_05540 [Clostridia bacterium]|nr:hypothetical protein [Clostridia bacterium]
MLYDIERTIKRMKDTKDGDEYKDLVYDLESFIIDMSFPEDDENGAQKRSYLGKIELVGKVLDEKETEKVFSKIRPVLLQLGIHECIKGFRLIEMCTLEAARIASSERTYQMKDIYPIVAKKFGITAHNCERLCRYACRGIVPSRDFAQKFPFFEELTHRTYEEVTVKELVDILVKYIIVKCNFRSGRNNSGEKR